MKKNLLVAGLVTVLVVLFGLSVASAEDRNDDAPVAIMEQRQGREQSGSGDCDLHDGDAAQIRSQAHEQQHSKAGSQDGGAGDSAGHQHAGAKDAAGRQHGRPGS